MWQLFLAKVQQTEFETAGPRFLHFYKGSWTVTQLDDADKR